MGWGEPAYTFGLGQLCEFNMISKQRTICHVQHEGSTFS